MPYEILRARYMKRTGNASYGEVVKVEDVEARGLARNLAFQCHVCGVQLRYVPKRNEQRAYFGRVRAPHGTDPRGEPCSYLLVEELQRVVGNGRRLMQTLFLRASGARAPAMRLEAVQELMTARDDVVFEQRLAEDRTRPARRRAVQVARALGSARAVVRLLVDMRRAGVREVSELMELDWRGQRIPWTDFFFPQEQVARLWSSVTDGLVTYPVAFVIRPWREVIPARHGFTVVGRRVARTTPYLNSEHEGPLAHIAAGQDVLAFGSPTAHRSGEYQNLRLQVSRMAQVAEVPFAHDEQGIAAE